VAVEADGPDVEIRQDSKCPHEVVVRQILPSLPRDLLLRAEDGRDGDVIHVLRSTSL
jgi:hypothetical protein